MYTCATYEMRVFFLFVIISLPVPQHSAVVITGCSSGIGADLAVALSKRGFLVFATVRKVSDGDELKKVGILSAFLILLLFFFSFSFFPHVVVSSESTGFQHVGACHHGRHR